MKLSRIAVVLAVIAALVLPLVLLAAYAKDPWPLWQTPPAKPKAAPVATLTKGVVLIGGDEPWSQGPIPNSILARVSGVARDEQGRPVAKANVTLYAVADDDGTPAATTTTDADGRYEFHDVPLPVMLFQKDSPYAVPPHAWFLVSGQAPGLGIVWRRYWSMYMFDPAVGQLRVGSTAVLDLTFAKAAVLLGKVVDERGRPVVGAEVRVVDAALIDAEGRESGEVQGVFEYQHWAVPPDGVGRTRTGADGGFQLEGLAARTCCVLNVIRPGASAVTLAFHAATVDGPDQTHEWRNIANKVIGGHTAVTNPITVVFPEPRLIDVSVVGDDDQPVAGARVTLSNTAKGAMGGMTASGVANASGKLRIELPPGTLGYLNSKPPAHSRYLTTFDSLPDVEPGDAPLAIEIRHKIGAELILEAVDGDTDKPMPGVFFWWTVEDRPGPQGDSQQAVEWILSNHWTDEDGKLHVAVEPDPSLRCRFHFGGLRGAISLTYYPVDAQKYGYEASPAQSEPVEIVAGKPIHLRFELRKANKP